MPAKNRPPPPSKNNEYNLFVREDSLQFGEAWASSRFPWKLTIENRGSTEVVIGRFIVSCSCLETTPESLTIPAGQSRDLQLVVDASPKPSERPTPDVIGFGVIIQPAVNQNGTWKFPAEWQLRGRIKRLLSPDTVRVAWEKQSDRAPTLRSRQIAISSRVALRSLQASTTSPYFRVEVEPKVNSTTDFQVTITPAPTLPVGIHTLQAELLAELADRSKIPAGKLHLQAEIAADLQASPPHVHFGQQQTGKQCEEAVVVHSLSALPFKVISHRAEGEGLSLEPSPSNGPGVFLVRQTVGHPGKREGRLSFTLENDQGKRIERIVPVQHIGIASVQP